VKHPQQIDLFGEERQRASMAVPGWQELPPETQVTLTDLIAQLIREHAQGRRTRSGTEAGHDL
jgi:hypothetical protein